MTPREYAQAVRDALADLPASEREELLEDLDDHLAEVAAESDVPLEERLGSPLAYAAELRAVYGGRTAEPSVGMSTRARRRIGRLPGAAHARLMHLPPYRQAASFLPDLRPGWWVLRGYAAALLLLSVIEPVGLTPNDPVAWLFTLTVIWASVWLGRRTAAGTGPGWGRAMLIMVNAAAGLLIVAGVVEASHMEDLGDVALQYDDYGPAPVGVSNVAMLDGGEIYNILPYAEDGTPLKNVRLYDQDGKPITLDPEAYGQTIDRPCDAEPPILNAYPLPLKSTDEVIAEYDRTPACVQPLSSPSALPSEAPSASASASGEPSPSESPTSTPSPKATGSKE
jgi:hypothetical protein